MLHSLAAEYIKVCKASCLRDCAVHSLWGSMAALSPAPRQPSRLQPQLHNRLAPEFLCSPEGCWPSCKTRKTLISVLHCSQEVSETEQALSGRGRPAEGFLWENWVWGQGRRPSTRAALTPDENAQAR